MAKAILLAKDAFGGRTLWLLLTALALITVLFAACGDDDDDAGDDGEGTPASSATPIPDAGEVRILFSTALTGDVAELGTDFLHAAELAADLLVNEKGGFQSGPFAGATLKIEAIDDGVSAEAAAVTGERYVDDEDIFAATGFLGSGLCQAAGQAAARANLVIVCSGGGADFLVTDNDNIYIGQASGETFGWCAADYIANDLGLTRIADISSDFDFIDSFHKGLDDHSAEVGLESVSSQTVQYGEPDYRVVLTNVKDAGPEIVLLGNFDADNGRLVSQAREIGLDVPLMEYIGVGFSNTFVDLAGDNALGFYLSVGADVSPQPDSFTEEVAAEFQSRYGKEFGSVQQAFQSVHAIVLAIEAGAENREQLGQYLERDFGVEGVMGNVGFGANRKLLEARISLVKLNGTTAADQEPVAVCLQKNDGTVERVS